MKMIKAYIAYLKDNPEHYWFKRKAYGWGWTPATKEGWLVTGGFLVLVLFFAWRAESAVTVAGVALNQFAVPFVVVTLLFIVICYKMGERPRWQWQIPKKYFKD